MELLCISTAPLAKLLGTMIVNEIATIRGCDYIWLETNYKLVSLAFTNHSILPCQPRTCTLIVRY